MIAKVVGIERFNYVDKRTGEQKPAVKLYLVRKPYPVERSTEGLVAMEKPFFGNDVNVIPPNLALDKTYEILSETVGNYSQVVKFEEVAKNA